MSDLRSNSNAAPRGAQSARQWQRWQMTELPAAQASNTPMAQPKQAGQAKPSLSDEERFEQLRKAAHKSGYSAGHKAGFEQGLAEGREQGHAEAHEVGLAEGRAQAVTELETRSRAELQPLHTLMQSLAEAQGQMDDEIAHSLVELALCVGQQLARDALDAKPESLLHTVRELLHSEPALSGKPRLWLHPVDLQLVETQLGGEITAAGWQLQPDDAMQRGGCRLISRSGEIDASWEERVALVWRQVRSPRRRRQTVLNSEATTDSNKKPSGSAKK